MPWEIRRGGKNALKEAIGLRRYNQSLFHDQLYYRNRQLFVGQQKNDGHHKIAAIKN
jgi:hypothetical protein